MKKLLVYLHGFGFDKTNNIEFQKQLAKKLNADLLAINAPFPSERERGGFAWYTINKNPKKHILDKKLIESENKVRKYIYKELKKTGKAWKDVILCGRSQGALLSLIIGLKSEEECTAIIPIAGFFYKDIPYFNFKHNPKIIWLEAKNDTVLTNEKKESYKILEEMGVKLNYFIDENSDHDNINESVIDIIKREINN